MQTQTQVQHHALPRWLHWVQTHLFLSALLLAEAYLLGDLMQRGWVGNIEQPSTWGTYHGVGVVLFFAAGAMAAGIALQCSVTAAEAFQTRRPLLGLFNMLGVLVFAGSEIWASLSERSANLRPSPADQAVLSLLNVRGLPLSPTVVVVALLLPFATVFYGFSQRKPPQETAEERHERQQRELEHAQHKAALREVRAAGWTHAARAAFEAAKQSATTAEEPATMLTEVSDEPTDEDEPEVRPMRPRPAAQRGIPAGKMSAPQFVRFLSDNGVTISEEEARKTVRNAVGFRKVGTTYYADRRALNAVAKRRINEAHPTIQLVG